MLPKVDVSIAFFGKPYQTITTIESLLKFSREHIGKIYLTHERSQPHGDYAGIYKVLEYFRHKDAPLEVFRPRYFVSVGVNDYDRTIRDTAFRQSIMFQYPLEVTDKKYLCVMHNDMLFHGDLIGYMLQRIEAGPENLAGIGSVGQCWSCPAGPAWGNRCRSEKYREYVPDAAEALELAAAYDTPRKELQMEVIRAGRVHLLPECRLNEYCALIRIDTYRKETIPAGKIGCYGGSWGGIDLGTVWSHDMYKKGYIFENVLLEDFARHAAFDVTGSGSQSYTRAETYRASEANALDYIVKTHGPLKFGWRLQWNAFLDSIRRKARMTAGAVYQRIRGRK